jgi:hypothetical protein
MVTLSKIVLFHSRVAQKTLPPLGPGSIRGHRKAWDLALIPLPQVPPARWAMLQWILNGTWGGIQILQWRL